ncbi:MAG TPA: Asp-tRNA(Asn)/Glu-tRNA(Gln) amidotransferase subunit GatC [Candidatus Parcubacteria bacterium]|jgi:aspartyl-tRNA(Asn)/glutamyl-tRNA(Gln) amidotransferase subunit C|nr:Asp-tRNA(Asn)/Glu-tRNA(Gln) amidotransferase GatCAB subunit C [Parcubacteria group bacterium]HJN62084.1 Asp-tRNA(Asn)/Glu-tRNA(Gln) amidotransferase subunit GatC [Candidatus Parcubacteria bacterium]|tara:strand:+ start:570 stop:857 length:288 start_codon:yes stop_codon:yes gene_type:complete
MISKKEVEHIAKLARLGLSQSEIKKFQKELSSVLDYVVKLKEVDISKTKATSHSILVKNVTRKDLAKKEDLKTVKRIIEMAPERRERYIKVKAVL